MKLFLDVAWQFLIQKRDYYQMKAKGFLIVSAIMWISGILAVCMLIHAGLLVPALLTGGSLLFAAVFTILLAKDNYVKAGVYGQISEDLEEIRKIANKKAKKEVA